MAVQLILLLVALLIASGTQNQEAGLSLICVVNLCLTSSDLLNLLLGQPGSLTVAVPHHERD